MLATHDRCLDVGGSDIDIEIKRIKAVRVVEGIDHESCCRCCRPRSPRGRELNRRCADLGRNTTRAEVATCYLKVRITNVQDNTFVSE